MLSLLKLVVKFEIKSEKHTKAIVIFLKMLESQCAWK